MTDSRNLNTKGSIAQVVETLDTGGAEHLAIKFANALAQRGYASHLYVTSHSGPLAAAINDDVKVRIFGYRRASITNPIKFGMSIREGFSHFQSALKSDGVGLVQTHLPSPNFWGLALQKSGKCQSVATIHNNVEFSYGSHRSIRGNMRHFAYRSIITNCAATIAVSDQVRVSLMEELGIKESDAKQFVSIPNGIELPEQRPASECLLTRQALGIPADKIVCLSVGRVCEQKNFKDLVPVGKILKSKMPNIQLVIAGDGPDMPDLQERIAESGLGDTILTLGNITNVPEVLAAADIFVMPSLWEGLPLALLEAMGNCLPVVGNTIDGLDEIVVEGEMGYLVPAGSHEAMAMRIVDLANNKDLRAKMGNASRALVNEHYNLNRVIDSLEDLYQGILS